MCAFDQMKREIHLFSLLTWPANSMLSDPPPVSDRGQSWPRGPYPVPFVTQVLDQSSPASGCCHKMRGRGQGVKVRCEAERRAAQRSAEQRRAAQSSAEERRGAQRSAEERRGAQHVPPRFSCCPKVRNKQQSFLGYPGSSTLFQLKNKTQTAV